MITGPEILLFKLFLSIKMRMCVLLRLSVSVHYTASFSTDQNY